MATWSAITLDGGAVMVRHGAVQAVGPDWLIVGGHRMNGADTDDLINLAAEMDA